MRRSRLATALTAFVSLAALVSSCDARGDYPDRPVLIVCPWSTGGGTDRVSRQIAVFLEAELGVPVNVINATGGGGVTGHSRGSRARPDGCTLTMMTVEINMLRWRKLTRLSWEDFRPLMLINRDAAALFVRADAPWADLAALEEAIRADPGKLTASGTATGGIWHLALAGWLRSAGLAPADAKWISFGGAGPSLQELASRGLDMVCCSLPEARTMLEGGEVRCLGVMADEPVPGYERIPTFRSLGADWSMGGWRGLAAPVGTPDPVVEKLLAALRRIVEGERVIRVEIRGDGASTETLAFPDFMRREGYDASWELPEAFEQTLARTDAELGALLTSPELATVSRNPIGPMTFPYALFGIGGASLALLALGRLSKGRPVAGAVEEGSAGGRAVHFVEVVAAVVIYIVLVEPLGFVLTAGGILFLLLARLGTRTWASALITALLVPAVYLVFAWLLRVPLPHGLLGW